MNDLDLYLAVV